MVSDISAYLYLHSFYDGVHGLYIIESFSLHNISPAWVSCALYFHSFMLQCIELISYIISLVFLLSRECCRSSYSGLSCGLLFCRFTHSLKRRLRIRTLQYSTARDINDLYDSVDSEVVLSILVHKVFCHHLLLKCLKQYDSPCHCVMQKCQN